MLLQENVPLKNLTTMRLGGPASFVLDLTDPADCVEAFSFIEEKSLPFFFLGLGANSIARDPGFPGVIVRNKITSLELLDESPSGLTLRVGGGCLWDALVDFVVEKGYTGCEALSGIPSSVAAAPVQNIGAYGQELKDSLISLEVFDTLLNEYTEIDAADCAFSYRHSIFNSGETKGRYFILFCTFRFSRGEITPPLYASLEAYLSQHKITSRSPATIRSAVLNIRSEKLPDPGKIASSGSFFKNLYLSDAKDLARAQKLGVPLREMPDGTFKVNTAWLLDTLGLPGKNFYGFELLPAAPLVLVNRSATSELDLEKAKSEINHLVKAKFGFTLSQEPDFVEEYPL